MRFGLAFLRLQPVKDSLDLLFADIDEGLDLLAEITLPGEFGLDLELERPIRRADRMQIFPHAVRCLLEVPGNTRETLIDLGRRDLDFVGLGRSEEHTSELQSLMRISYAVFCLNKI